MWHSVAIFKGIELSQLSHGWNRTVVESSFDSYLLEKTFYTLSMLSSNYMQSDPLSKDTQNTPGPIEEETSPDVQHQLNRVLFGETLGWGGQFCTGEARAEVARGHSSDRTLTSEQLHGVKYLFTWLFFNWMDIVWSIPRKQFAKQIAENVIEVHWWAGDTGPFIDDVTDVWPAVFSGRNG